MPKKITIEIYDSAISTSPMYLQLLQEELERLLASKGLKILEVKETLESNGIPTPQTLLR